MCGSPRLRFSTRIRCKHRNSTTRDSRPDTVGTAGENDGNPCTQYQTRAVGICEEGELLREHVAGFKIRGQKNVRIARDRRLDSLRLRRGLADSVVEGERAV